MEIKAARRIASLPEYAFKVIQDRVLALEEKGITPLDFGVGDPSSPTPLIVRQACQAAIDERAKAGYPSYIGELSYRQAIARWMKRRFSVELDPTTEISATIGSKEGIFNFHEAFVDPGDIVLVPSPGYPPYSRGTWFAEGEVWFYPLDEASGFLPDLAAIPAHIAKRAKIVWINYPNSPTGVCPGRDFFERVYAWANSRGIILASDEAYSEFYFGQAPPPSALEVGKDGVVVFNSLSKRSSMTGYRVGFLAGDKRIIDLARKAKTNMDSGTPTFIQDAAIAALADETHVVALREEYREKRDILVDALSSRGLKRAECEGTIFLWQKAPDGMSSLEFTAMLMRPEIAIVATPGSLLAEPVEGGRNPGEGYARFSLTPTLDAVKTAAQRLAQLSF